MKKLSVIAGLTLAGIMGVGVVSSYNSHTQNWAKVDVSLNNRGDIHSNKGGIEELYINRGTLICILERSSDSDGLTKQRLYINDNLKYDRDIDKMLNGKYPKTIYSIPDMTDTTNFELGKNTIKYETVDTLRNINSSEAYIYVEE